MLKKGGFVVLCVVVLVSLAPAQEIRPVAVSPGVENGIARVGERCPTFSWSAVGWAVRYRVAVFEAGSADAKTYERTALAAAPALMKDIDGKALSWTPSEPLVEGRAYIWYVQALDAAGNGLWSEGKTFRVEVERTAVLGLEDGVARKLRERGVSESVIAEAAGEARKAAKAGAASQSSSSKTLTDAPSGYLSVLPEQDLLGTRDRGSEIGLNTWYGNQAGAALLSGAAENSFFGYRAGTKTTKGNDNTFVGAYAGANNTIGNSNAFFGGSAGGFNTTGSDNAFFGHRAGFGNITGKKNVFVGKEAGRWHESGNNNTLIGFRAGYHLVASQDNTFVGFESGYATDGISNTFVGAWAGRENTYGDGNTFIGTWAGKGNTRGSNNTFVGLFSGQSNTTGRENTFVGVWAGSNVTTGVLNTFIGKSAGGRATTGSRNTFIGNSAGSSVGSNRGNDNVAIGVSAGANISTGGGNTFIGTHAGGSNSTGWENTFVGKGAGESNSTGELNVIIGYAAGQSNTTGSGNVFVGPYSGTTELGSNKLYIDNSAASFPLIYGDFRSKIVGINGYLGVRIKTPTWPVEVYGGAYCDGKVWVDASSRSLKTNIRGLAAEDARQALSGLVPVRFHYKEGPADESLGFIAEDVPELVATQGRKGMSAMDVVAVLTKVVQEQQKAIDELRRKVEALENR